MKLVQVVDVMMFVEPLYWVPLFVMVDDVVEEVAKVDSGFEAGAKHFFGPDFKLIMLMNGTMDRQITKDIKKNFKRFHFYSLQLNCLFFYLCDFLNYFVFFENSHQSSLFFCYQDFHGQ
jgi:hypothetical protein